MHPNAYGVYKNNSVNFASKEQMLLMLLDGAVKFAKRGKLAIQEAIGLFPASCRRFIRHSAIKCPT